MFTELKVNILIDPNSNMCMKTVSSKGKTKKKTQSVIVKQTELLLSQRLSSLSCSSSFAQCERLRRESVGRQRKESRDSLLLLAESQL